MVKIDCSILPESERCMRRMFANNLSSLVEDAGCSLRKKDSKSAKIVVASVVKKVCQNMFLQKSVKGHIDIDECNDLVEVLYSKKEEEGGGLEYNKQLSSKKNAIAGMCKMVARFKFDFAGRFNFPAGVEFQDIIDVSIEGAYKNLKISGKIPVVTGESMYTYNTSAKKEKTSHAKFGAYNILLGERGLRCREIKLPLVGPRTMQPDTELIEYDTKNSTQIAALALNRVNMAVEVLKNNESIEKIPSNPHCKMCSEKYCNAFQTSFCRRY